MALKPRTNPLQALSEQKPSAPNVLVRPDTRVSEWEQPNMAAGFTAPANCLPQECEPDWMAPMSMTVIRMRKA